MKVRNLESRRTWTCAALAAAIGLAIGWLDLHTTEVTVSVVALLLAGLPLGVFRPEGAWRWGLTLALGLPAMAVVGGLRGWQTPEPIQLDPRIALFAFFVACIGCYTGVLLRRIADEATREEPGTAPPD